MAANSSSLKGPILLLVATALAMVWANSPWAEGYHDLVRLPFEVRLGEWSLQKPVLLWVNDGLMAVFFLLIGLEVKREFLQGALRTRAAASLPLLCAVGGMVVPAGVYAAITSGDPEAQGGWAIPVATDIAFALGAVAVLGSRIPIGVRVFLMAVAVFDDILAIVVIAAFYTDNISWTAKAVALGLLAILFVLNRLKVRRLDPYLAVGLLLWFTVLKSGVHATVAGVLVGLLIPIEGAPGRKSPLAYMESALHPWITWVVLPLFAFANAGVDLAGVTVGSLAEPVTLGIVVGLCVGKPIGVIAAAWIGNRCGIRLPAGVNWMSLAGAGFLAGIGFTMSLFIGTLAFEDSIAEFETLTRLGVILGSVVSAALGLFLLAKGNPRGKVVAEGEEPAEPADSL